MRAFGPELAELPLLATRPELQGNGLAPLLLRSLETALLEAGVSRVIMPALPLPEVPLPDQAQLPGRQIWSDHGSDIFPDAFQMKENAKILLSVAIGRCSVLSGQPDHQGKMQCSASSVQTVFTAKLLPQDCNARLVFDTLRHVSHSWNALPVYLVFAYGAACSAIIWPVSTINSYMH